MYGESWEPQPFSFAELLTLEIILCQLEHCSDDDILDCENPPGVIQRLQQLQDKLDHFQFKNAYRFFTLELDYLRHSLNSELKKGNNSLGDYADNLQLKIKELRETVKEDASSLAALRTESLLFSLVDTYFLNPLEAFGLPEELASRLPDEITENVKEASRCLVLGFSSAAILFTCLATEAFVKHHYYPGVAGGKSPLDKKGEFLSWGSINDQLRNKYRCPSFIIDELDEIRDKYRNQAMHAELDLRKEPDMDTKVWNRCKHVVSQMLDDLEIRGP